MSKDSQDLEFKDFKDSQVSVYDTFHQYQDKAEKLYNSYYNCKKLQYTDADLLVIINNFQSIYDNFKDTTNKLFKIKNFTTYTKLNSDSINSYTEYILNNMLNEIKYKSPFYTIDLYMHDKNIQKSIDEHTNQISLLTEKIQECMSTLKSIKELLDTKN